jgi:hypothetical protein
MVDHPLHRRIHLSRLCHEVGPPLSDDVANYCFPVNWPADREQRASIIGEWLQTEARFSA